MKIFVQYEKYLYLIFFIGVIIYYPIFFNGFVWDDIGYILGNSQVHQLNLPALFGQNMFNSGPFYRPLPAVYFAIIYSLSGQHAFLYHLIQLILHLADTSLLFLYFCFFFSDGIAFFLALVFLVHPINVESVAYIGSTQSELYFLPGIAALLLAQKKEISRARFLWISGFLLFTIFTKETGFLFLFLLLIYRFLFRLNKIKAFVGTGVVICTIYFIFRVFVAGVTYGMLGFVRTATIPFWQRLFLIPPIIVYYLKIFLFPLYLLVWQTWVVTEPSLGGFFLPLFLCIIFFSLLLIAYYVIYKKENNQVQTAKKAKNHEKRVMFGLKQKQFLFFFLWYGLGMGMLLQFVPLDMTVADRWFYFPIVGILGMIGVVLELFIPAIKRNRRIYFSIAIIIIFLLSLRTFVRTFDWKNNISLYSHDLQYEPTADLLLNGYATELFYQGEKEQACYYINKSISVFPTMLNEGDLANCYLMKGQYSDAVFAITRAIQLTKLQNTDATTKLHLYYNKALALQLAGRSHEADNFLTTVALKEFPQNELLLQLVNNKQPEQTNTSVQNNNSNSQPSDYQRTMDIINPVAE